MLKRILTVVMLLAASMSSFATPIFAQDPSGQTMQSENKMADPMMKSHKSKRKSRKNKAHKKSMMKSDKMKTGYDPM